MMSCFSADRIYLYLEGELGPDDRRAFEEHLGSCPICRDALEERRPLHQAFTSLPPLEIPLGFARAVMARIPERTGTALSRAAAFATGALALMAGLLALHFLLGKSLADTLIQAIRSLTGGFGGLLPLLAKVLKSAALVLEILYELASALAGGLRILFSYLGPGTLGLILSLGSLLLLLLLFGAKRLLSLGEKT